MLKSLNFIVSTIQHYSGIIQNSSNIQGRSEKNTVRYEAFKRYTVFWYCFKL